MKYIDEYRDPALAKKLVQRISCQSTRPARLMEFCGGHTTSIMKSGIRQLLPETVQMLSGPGCPVCVTANRDLDRAIALAALPGVIVATFGDMMRVPGSTSSLQAARAEGRDVRVVYSTLDALAIARENPAKSVVFIGVGFETTAPTVAASIIEAEEQGIDNYYVLSLHKLCPPIMRAILDRGEVNISGIICPGHVSAVIGSLPYRFIPDEYRVACVVSGFEPLDILLAVSLLVEQIETGDYKVEIAYRRGVRPEGNRPALDLIEQVFEVCDADWRGIGVVAASGLALKEAYRRFDAESNFAIEPEPTRKAAGCICGAILRGVSTPRQCPLFREDCTPEHPVGPCMVSSEGACASYYQFEGAMPDRVLLAHGSGGRLSHDLVGRLVAGISNPILDKLDDSAVFELGGRLAFTTDSYIVSPIFFPGGDIGRLAVCGTVNDLAMGGAVPRYLSLSLIIEEGLPFTDLERVIASIGLAAREAGVLIVTGDTKVVNHGSADRLFINTAGIGVIPPGIAVSGANARPGDRIILSGTIGDHGIAIMGQREGIRFNAPVESDCAPLNQLVAQIISPDIHCLRDPTRGGLATVLNEFAAQSAVGIKIYEKDVPVNPAVAGAAEMLGLDPLFIANEGKLVAVVAAASAGATLARMKNAHYGEKATIIGEVVAAHPGRVVMQTALGSSRIVDMPAGELLPRIC